MRSRALSILRAQQLIIKQCHVTYDCLDVNIRNFGPTPRKGVAPRNSLEKDWAVESPDLSSLIVSVAARDSRPASAIWVLIRR